MLIFLYTAYIVIGLFLASNYAEKIEKAEKYQDINKPAAIIAMTAIISLWPVYLIYKFLTRHGHHRKR